MIFRLLLISVLSFFSIKCFSQKDASEILKDVYDMPHSMIVDYDTINKFTTVDYFTLNGQKISASSGIEYSGGRDSLRQYFKRMYYKLVNPTYDELNQRVFLCILFDKHLNIREIRFFPPKLLYRREYYERLFTKIAKSTQGEWNATIKKQDWYFYFFGDHFF